LSCLPVLHKHVYYVAYASNPRVRRAYGKQMKDLAMTHLSDAQFYDRLAPVPDFARLADPACFARVPNDWVLGTADIVDSTGEIACGRYKTVNMVGAAVISAMTNAMGGRAFPFVFGGDGAGFAVPPEHEATARDTLAALRRWAEEELSIELRAALVTVERVRRAGHDLLVARHAASPGVDYAMFSGGGLAWAETAMKAGSNLVPPASPGVQPDLTGLSCRWSNARACNGMILSLVAEPAPGAPVGSFQRVARHITALSEGLSRAGHPLPEAGPPITWPPPGLTLDAHVSRKGGNLMLHRARLLGQNLLIWLLFRTGIRLGRFEPDHYARAVSQNADFRKMDDGLKMTLDCDDATRARIEAALEEARAAGLIRYGLHVQDEAMVTCFVPSAMTDDHVHFVDGAAGGYARAAAAMRG